MINNMKKHLKLIKKFIKYWIWWWVAALLDLLLLWIFTEKFGIYYIYSSILSFCIIIVIWFLYQKHIAFSHKWWNKFRQWMMFLIFQLIWMWLNVILLWIFATKLGFYYLWIAFINKWLIYIWNFSMNYLFTFK